MSKLSQENYTPPKSGSSADGTYSILIHYTEIEYDLKLLAGRILTIIDGAITSEKQNKAIKDQIKKEIKERIFYFQKVCSKDEAGHSIQF